MRPRQNWGDAVLLPFFLLGPTRCRAQELTKSKIPRAIWRVKRLMQTRAFYRQRQVIENGSG